MPSAIWQGNPDSIIFVIQTKASQELPHPLVSDYQVAMVQLMIQAMGFDQKDCPFAILAMNSDDRYSA